MGSRIVREPLAGVVGGVVEEIVVEGGYRFVHANHQGVDLVLHQVLEEVGAPGGLGLWAGVVAGCLNRD